MRECLEVFTFPVITSKRAVQVQGQVHVEVQVQVEVEGANRAAGISR